MVDTVTSNTILDGERQLIVQRINESDGTGQSAAIFVDASAFPSPSAGTSVSFFVVEEIQWSIQGFDSVKLAFDATADTPFAVLTGNNFRIYEDAAGIADPGGAGSTGDIVVTTVGSGSSTATYDIAIWLRKVY